MLRPVNAADSRSFRWITVLHAYLPILAASLAWLATGWFAGRAGSGTLFIFAHVQISALWLLGLLPGAVSYSFQLPGMSVERQNRAIALSYYAWAPLALAPLTIALGTAGAWLLMWPYGNAWSDLFGVFAMLPCGMLLFWPVGVAHEFRRFGLRQFIANSRAYRFAIGLLALAVFVGAFLLPLSLLYISAIVYSLL